MRRRSQIGVGLIILSGIFWFSIFAVPLAPLTIGQKSVLAGGLFAAVQLCWWTGAALAGPKVVMSIKNWFSWKPKE